MERTQPKSRGVTHETDPASLAAGRYGTDDMINIWGPENTFQLSLNAQAAAIDTLSDLYPDIVPPEDRDELVSKANLDSIDPARIREIEESKGHDVIAINTSWGEQVSPKSAAHINKARTSADTTETAKALQLKRSTKVIVDSLENLRDITLEKAINWKTRHVDVTHLYDALPTLAGRPFMFYVEMLQTGIDLLAHFYANSIVGKWADATGNHHSATALGIDGMALQEEYCRRLGIGHMIAPAQIPGREFIADLVYGMARSAETMANLSGYMRWGRSHDVGIFKVPRKRKGSSAMPHKDAVGGNPIVEEQAESFVKYMRGVMSTMLSSCGFDYARDLSASASDRICLEDMYKFGDHVIRRLAKQMYELELIEERCLERFDRTFGVLTSQQVMTYLTDHRKTENPMSREDASDLMGRLASQAYDEQRMFVDVLLDCDEVTSRLPEDTIIGISDPLEYLGQSREIMERVFDEYHGRRALQLP
jgi:adenylosuccinate lyase